MRFTRTTAAVAATGLTAFTLVACGDNKPEQPSLTDASSTSVSAESTDTTGATTTTEAPAELATVAAAQSALQTAAGAVPGGQPFDLEVEVTDGQVQFEAKVASDGDEHKLVIDAAGEKVISQTKSDKPDDDVAKLAGTTVTAAQALDTASGKQPEAQFKELEIDTNDADVVIWEVELVDAAGAETEYTIDAHTGEVLTP